MIKYLKSNCDWVILKILFLNLRFLTFFSHILLKTAQKQIYNNSIVNNDFTMYCKL